MPWWQAAWLQKLSHRQAMFFLLKEFHQLFLHYAGLGCMVTSSVRIWFCNTTVLPHSLQKCPANTCIFFQISMSTGFVCEVKFTIYYTAPPANGQMTFNVHLMKKAVYLAVRWSLLSCYHPSATYKLYEQNDYTLAVKFVVGSHSDSLCMPGGNLLHEGFVML